MTHFYEANKDRFIDRNSNLTYEQAQEIKDFFNAHTDAENIIDWNTSDRLTYDDFKNAIDAYNRRNTNSNADRIANKVGLAGIELGKDYLDLGEYITKSFGTFHAYSPLTHLGAKTLAGPQVPPVQKDKNSAAWCIGYSGNDVYWERYCANGSYFIILCGEKIPTLKVCLELCGDKKTIFVWDYYDSSTLLNTFFKNHNCSENDVNIIYNLINLAKEQGAYEKRMFDDNCVYPSIEYIEDMLSEKTKEYIEKYGKEVVQAYLDMDSPIDHYEDYLDYLDEDDSYRTSREEVIHDMTLMINAYLAGLDRSLLKGVHNSQDFLKFLSKYDPEKFFYDIACKIPVGKHELEKLPHYDEDMMVIDELTDIVEKYKDGIIDDINGKSLFTWIFRLSDYNLRKQAFTEIQDCILNNQFAEDFVYDTLTSEYEDFDKPFITNEEQTVFFRTEDLWDYYSDPFK